MNNNINIFEKYLDKYNLRLPEPLEMQKYILKSKKRNYIKTLKGLGEYNIIYGLVLRIFFHAQRFGISLSLAQSKLVLGILFAAGIILLSAGILFSANFIKSGAHIQTLPEPPEIIGIEKSLQKTPPKNDMPESQTLKTFTPAQDHRKPKHQDTDDGVKTRLVINRLTPNNIDEDSASNVTDRLYQKLRSAKGANRVIFREKNGIHKSINRQLIELTHKLAITE